MQQQRARVPTPGQAGEPEAGDPGLSEAAPLLEFVVAVADYEPLAFASRRVHLVEVGQGRLSRLVVGHVDLLGGNPQRDGPGHVGVSGVAEKLALGRLRRLQWHDHCRSRHLDVSGRSMEARPSQRRLEATPLLPGRVHGERGRVAGPGHPTQSGERRLDRRRIRTEQDRAAWSVVDAVAAERARTVPQQGALLDGDDGDRAVLEFEDVPERRPAEAPLEFTPGVRLKCLAHRAADGQIVPGGWLPARRVDETRRRRYVDPGRLARGQGQSLLQRAALPHDGALGADCRIPRRTAAL